MTTEFLLTSVILTLTPGPGVVFTLAASLSRGAKAGVVAALACTLGIVPHMLLALTGAAAVLAASPAAFETIRWLGVAYLLYMAWGSWTGTGALTPSGGGEAPSYRATVTSALLVNLLNPKLSLFFFAFLPLFVDSNAPGALWRMALLSALFMAVTLVIFVGYGLCAALLSEHVVTRPAVMAVLGRVFAVSFVAMAAHLALVV
ncbi:LysE family translocator [Nocardiopsis metallicus]|uniref:Threonine/homoserine/homoserine lactone efflux protein n=1 Tax=Nocardiopsis metallicus TaxID=179819 RepID=A0A840WAN3_9ACTN|nr:LysE family translocator [Nocardiopsis metallicus]MBB5489115.1 threonine/homoserine/homoserine lactone efflux protein [Nocardiopsis metallicus]